MGEIEVTIHIDRSLDLAVQKNVTRGKTIGFLKQALSEETGTPREEIVIALLPPSGRVLSDDVVITEDMKMLEIKPADEDAGPEAMGDDKVISDEMQEPEVRPASEHAAPEPKGDDIVITDANKLPEIGSSSVDAERVQKAESKVSKPKAETKVPKQTWRVVGGGDKGGLMVRKGEDLKSDEESKRLATDSLVLELELVNGRLHYELLVGAGPRSGWVSLVVKGNPLLVKDKTLPEKGCICTEETYTRERAMQMMDEFIAAYSESSFQKKLRQAFLAAGNNPVAQGKVKQAACLPVQVPIIIKYGFEPNMKGVTRSVSLSSKLSTDKEIQDKGGYLSWLVDPSLQDATNAAKQAAVQPAAPGTPSLVGVPITEDTGETKVKGVTADGKYVFAYVGKLKHAHDVLAVIPLAKGIYTEEDLLANRAKFVFAGGTTDKSSSDRVQKEVIIDVQGLEKGEYELGAFPHDDYEDQLNGHLQRYNCVLMFNRKASHVVAQYKA